MVLEVVIIGAVVIQIKQYCVGGSIGVDLNVGYVLVSVKPDTSEILTQVQEQRQHDGGAHLPMVHHPHAAPVQQ